MTRSIFWLFVLMAFSLTSCFNDMIEKIDDIEDITWNPTLALPITSESLSIAEFTDELSGEEFGYRTDDEGLVIITYAQNEVFSKTAEEIIEINDETFNTTFILESDLATDLPVTGTVTQRETHNFSISTPSGDKLYTASLKGGQLDITLSGDFPASGEMTLTFNTITVDDAPLSTTFRWSYDGSNAQEFVRSLDLARSAIDFTDNNTTNNYFGFTADLTLNYEGQPVPSSVGMDLALDMLSMEFSQATVTVTQRTMESEQDQLELSIEEAIKGGRYYFDEPAVSFRFTNSFGVPIEVLIDQMIAHSDDRGDLAMIGTMIGTPVTIGFPEMSEMGKEVQTTLDINHTNSNMPNVLAWQPDDISYRYQSSLNASGSDAVHFLLDTSKISVDVALELPMIGKFQDLTFSENYDFDGSIFEDVEQAVFKLKTSNGFPIHANLQLYFLDRVGNLIDSLIVDDNNLLMAGITDSEGKVITPSSKETEVFVDKGRLQEISHADRIILRATLNTPNYDTQSVKIYEEDQLDLVLMVQTEFEITL